MIEAQPQNKMFLGYVGSHGEYQRETTRDGVTLVRGTLYSHTDKESLVRDLFPRPTYYDSFSGNHYRYNRLLDYTMQTGQVLDVYTVGQVTLLAVDDEASSPIPPEAIKRYGTEQDFHQGYMHNSCFYEATAATESHAATSVLSTDNGAYKFIPAMNHAVNYDLLPDGTHVAVDFTAILNVDGHGGNIDTFLMRAKSKPLLLEKLHALYGGNWDDIPPELYEYISPYSQPLHHFPRRG